MCLSMEVNISFFTLTTVVSVECPALYALIQTVFGHVLLQTSNHNPLDDLREEWEIRNWAVVADIGNIKALFLERRIV